MIKLNFPKQVVFRFLGFDQRYEASDRPDQIFTNAAVTYMNATPARKPDMTLVDSNA